MLKLIFWLLLGANALLFAYHQGYLEPLVPSGREPGRMRNQLNADRIRLITPPAQPPQPASDAAPASTAPAAAPATASATASATAATTNASAVTPKSAMPAATSVPTPAPTPVPTPVAALASDSGKPGQPAKATDTKTAAACTEFGNFNAADARRFQAQLAALSLSGKATTREIPETSSHMVFIPPKDGKEAAEKKVAELRRLNITDHYIIQDDSPQRWGISLGIFRTEEAARGHLAGLLQKGVRSAQLLEYKIPLTRLAFQLRGLDAAGSGQKIDRLKAGFPRHEVRDCG